MQRCVKLSAVSEELSEILDFGAPRRLEVHCLYIFQYYKKSSVFEWKFVPKFKRNQKRTFGFLRLSGPEGHSCFKTTSLKYSCIPMKCCAKF